MIRRVEDIAGRGFNALQRWQRVRISHYLLRRGVQGNLCVLGHSEGTLVHSRVTPAGGEH
jgi:hypothetical protein